MREPLRQLAADGKTVFLSSHMMSEMSLIAERLVVIGKGRLIADTSVEDFVARASAGAPVHVHAILCAIADGLTTAAISRELWVSEHTVKFHLTNIYRKLGVRNRAAAVRYAVERGLAPIEP